MRSINEKGYNTELLSKERVCSCFQPIVCLRTGKIFAYEALIRGVSPDSQMIISPADLFAVADAENKSAEFDMICQRSALEYFKEFSKTTDALLFMNINTSLISKDSNNFYDLNSMTQQMGFDPAIIGLELIESQAKSSKDLVAFVNHYRDTGFLIVADDFGCEHSNMERLIQIHPDIIKIDRSIISGIENDAYRQSILKSINSLSQMTGSLCLAEGVETMEEVLTCYMYGVDLFQGFAVAKPSFDLKQLEKDTNAKITEMRDIIKSKMVSFLRTKRRLTGNIDSLADWLVRQISTESLDSMELVFQEFIVINPEVECIYLLDKNGIQLSNTIMSPFLQLPAKSYVFSPARKGTDSSLKSYFTCFEAFRIKRYLTDPYLSSATGNICRTFSVKIFDTDADNDYIILCMDFVEEVIKTPLS
ncbi:MAG: EAL domain-containing protein [Spirochaetaceae bacterium]|nr:EAL domain-containing protein [Spirochaetaceae bacterium]